MEVVAEKKKEKFTGCSTCGTSGCNKLNVYDWLGNMQMPAGYKPLNIVEVRFKGSRKLFYRNVNNIELIIGDYVVVETGTGGHDVGMISLTGDLVRLQLKKYFIKEDSEEIKKIYRKANETDQRKYEEAKEREAPVLQRARTIALHQGLKMKLSDIEFQGDNSKAVFFYTAEDRVDFRALIKAYADEFKIRIEMRQIGYRQEASRLGGIGSCGRELCCSTWLTDFKIVSVNAARYQNLSINPLKLAGQCGKMKCCLNYELDTYVEALSEFPETSSERIRLRFESVSLKWVKTDILKRLMWFVAEPRNSEDTASPAWLKFNLTTVKEVLALNVAGTKPKDPDGFAVKEVIAEKLKDEAAEMSNIELDDDLNRFNKKKPQQSRRGNEQRRPDNRNQARNPNPNPNANPPRPNPNQTKTPPQNKPNINPNAPRNPQQNNQRNNNPRPPQNNNPRPPQNNNPNNNPNKNPNNNPNRNLNNNPNNNPPNKPNNNRPPQNNRPPRKDDDKE
jgi:cell fate regulator YaaT (PSP1 superfamily)